MASNNAFQMSGTTKLVAASSSTGVAATQVCTGNEQGVLLTNPSTVLAYLAFGSSSVSASIPTTSTPSLGAPLLGGAAGSFSLPGGNNVWLSAVTSAGTANIFATPGFGL